MPYWLDCIRPHQENNYNKKIRKQVEFMASLDQLEEGLAKNKDKSSMIGYFYWFTEIQQKSDKYGTMPQIQSRLDSIYNQYFAIENQTVLSVDLRKAAQRTGGRCFGLLPSFQRRVTASTPVDPRRSMVNSAGVSQVNSKGIWYAGDNTRSGRNNNFATVYPQTHQRRDINTGNWNERKNVSSMTQKTYKPSDKQGEISQKATYLFNSGSTKVSPVNSNTNYEKQRHETSNYSSVFAPNRQRSENETQHSIELKSVSSMAQRRNKSESFERDEIVSAQRGWDVSPPLGKSQKPTLLYYEPVQTHNIEELRHGSLRPNRFSVESEEQHQVGRYSGQPLSYSEVTKTALQKEEDSTNSKEVEEEPRTELIDMQQHFDDDFNPENLGVPKNSIAFFELIKAEAQKFEDSVKTFSGTNYSIEYFVLDEKLLRLIEHLDKTKTKDDSELASKKNSVITYIKNLQSILDSRAED